MRFDLVDLRLFLHVADAHSITHGARRANLTLASASERIRGMEKMLGVALLIRDRRGVSLSPGARAAHRAASRAHAGGSGLLCEGTVGHSQAAIEHGSHQRAFAARPG